MQQVITLPANTALTEANVRSQLAAAGVQGAVQQPLLIIQQSDPAASSAPAVVSLADLIRYVRKHWTLGLLVALPLAALTFWSLGMGRKIYEAESRILLRLQDPNVFNFNEMGRAAVTELSAPMLVNNHRSELKARRFMDYIYDKVSPEDRAALIADGAQGKSILSTVTGWFITPAPAVPMPEQDIFARKLDLALRVDPLKDSHILRIQVRTGNAALSARLANHCVEDYIHYVAEEELKTTKFTSEFLEGKGTELRRRLQKSEEELARYRQSQGLVQESETKDISGERVRLLTQTLSDTEAKLTRARQDFHTMQQALLDKRDLLDLKLVAENPDVAATRKLLDAKIAERAPLETWAGPKHPKIIAITNEITTHRQALDRNIAAVTKMIETDVSTLTKQTEDLAQQLDGARQELFAQGGKNVDQNLLRDKVSTDRDLYQKIMQRMNQTALTSEFKESGLLRVSDTAVAPLKPVKPSKPLAALASLFVFGLFMFGIPVGRGFAESHFAPRLRGEAQDNPAAPQPSGTSAPDGAALTAPASRDGALISLPDMHDATPTHLLGELMRPGSQSADALRELVTNLESRPRKQGGPGVILVASAEPGEGKTSVSSALAAGFCSHGRRVFMIECNSESPTFHLLFPHVYSHATWTSDGLESLRYGSSNLYILPTADSPAHDMRDLLENYRGWIEKARPQVDWIILDGSSVMRNFSDVAPLLPLATDVVLVEDQSRPDISRSTATMNLLRPRLGPETTLSVVKNRA